MRPAFSRNHTSCAVSGERNATPVAVKSQGRNQNQKEQSPGPESGVCQAGDARNQRPDTSCNPDGTWYCGTDMEEGGARVVGDTDLYSRRACSTSGDWAYGKLCLMAGSCCGAGA